ncbi:arginase arginase family [Vibrio variabilis]|uniref:Arginase arginase family n=1 Tax=Vibrio variabilis TaxID=990271 RepID=A0ABQ0JRF5_9VIBR|nr:arginase arginase family [Vibrio variabilis]
MLSVFKQLWKRRYHPVMDNKLSLLTVCEAIKPQTNAQFEDAESLLDTAYDWLSAQHYSHSMRNAGHFPILTAYKSERPYFENPMASHNFKEKLIEQLTVGAMPLLISNCHEALLDVFPSLLIEREEVGIININAHLLMDQCLDLTMGSMLHFALNRFNECRAFHIGIDGNKCDKKQLEYAEDMGCDWLMADEVNYRGRALLKEQLARFISHCDKLVLTIDLPSISKHNSSSEKRKLDIAMVLRALRQCLASNKVLLIQLVGAQEQHIYSKATQLLVQEIGEFYQ